MNDRGAKVMESSSAMRINSTLRSSTTTHGRNVTRSVSKWREVGGGNRGKDGPWKYTRKSSPQAEAATTVPSQTGIRRPTARVARRGRMRRQEPRTPAERKPCLEERDAVTTPWCGEGTLSPLAALLLTPSSYGAISRRWSMSHALVRAP